MKKKSLVLAICMVLGAPAISAAKGFPNDIVGLNLGDIQSSSVLGQSFRAVIPILFTSVEEAKYLKINLAPDSIFKKLGAEKLPFLNSLSFSVGTQNNKPVIFVRTSQPVDMPFLNFAIEMISAKGVVYQDYTILIDSPRHQNKVVNHYERAAAPIAKSLKVKIKATPITRINAFQGDIAYEVLEGETLIDIVNALKTSQISIKKMIDVIHKVNQKAFVNNDIDKLRSGIYLKIPSANKIKNFKFGTVQNKEVKKVKKQAIAADFTPP